MLSDTKKRVVESIRKIESDIQQSNSIVEGQERETDVRLSLKQREAEIRKAERDKIVKELQDKIDQYQTKIDAHNATVEIEVPDAELP